jgi:transcriptional regulator of acetoin/glycerol metabolism
VLVEYFIKLENKKNNSQKVSISRYAMEKLFTHRWPGNVRELENTIKRAIALSQDGRIMDDDIVFISSEPSGNKTRTLDITMNDDVGTLEDNLKNSIERTLYANDWNFTKTAMKLGIGRTTLWRKIKKYEIKRKGEGVT